MSLLHNHPPQQPRAKPPRSARLHFPPFQGNPGALTIAVGKESADYLLWEQPSDWGKAWRIEKVGADPAEGPYTVLIDPLEDRRECSCLGFLRHRDCKHVAALWALIQSAEI
jgi:hypothetical protein